MDQRISSFLERVEKQIYTEEESNLIRDELEDHIYCLVDDYKDAGHSENQAISKALLQMGDPNEIGYSFTDYDGMKKRKSIMFSLKITAALAIILPFVIPYFTGNSGPDSITSFLPMVINFSVLFMLFTVGSLLHGHSMKFLELDTTPYLILWPTKERFKWEYFAVSLFLLPMVLIFFGLYFYEEGLAIGSILNLWPVITISYGIWAIRHSEKYRIPKYMVVNDGFIIKGRLVSWTSVKSYMWSKDFLAKDFENHKLILTSYPREGQYEYKRTLSIHRRQKQYLERILREKMS